ncbi:MAG: 4-deoxy-4-formamido-L-arabinose-phosphoundecaprenol deformylase [Betaproteobacteria bacterium]|nr:4-deoxy-4-formamido-L-arabinose-phosphoundecaprenol deformylase [Betaproteobacteria bacterium]
MKRIALKIDVDTYRGTLHGVPALVDLLRRHDAQASFLFSLGSDHTGRAIKRAFRPGFMKKVKRTSVFEHYGLLTLLYGTLLPGPDIGRKCANILRAVRDGGFEVGIHCWDHVRWQDGVGAANNAWVEDEMGKAVRRFEEVFGEAPRTHGAAGWQMNRHALRLTQRLGFTYSSDGRGTHPYLPVIDGEIVACPQLPTTLPTLDELIGVDGLTAETVAEHLLRLTASASGDQVFTLHAELEGMKLSTVLDRLLAGWKAQGHALVAARDMVATLDTTKLPHHEVRFEEIPGRSGSLLVQGPEFLA